MRPPRAAATAFAWGDAAASRGWAIPTATDTVLALAALHAMGARVPASVKAILTALAIFDDGAMVILAAWFTMSLFFAGVAFANQPALSLSARVGVLAGSLVSAVLGAAFIMVAARPKATAE